MYTIDKIKNEYTLKIKLLIRNKTAFVIYIATIAVFIFSIAVIDINAEDNSRIPIGFADEDATEYSLELISAVSDTGEFKVYTADRSELAKLLGNGRIECWFLIRDGYMDSVKKGDITNLIKLYYNNNSEFISAISDIVAGKMMYNICTNMTYERYMKEMPESTLSYDDFLSAVSIVAGGEEFDFGFNIIYSERASAGTNIRSTAIIYKKIVNTIMILLLAITAMTAVSQTASDLEIKNAIAYRRKTTVSGFAMNAASSVLTAVTYNLVPIIIMSTVSSFAAGNAGSEAVVCNIIILFLLLLLYTVLCAMLFTALAALACNSIAYKIYGVIMIFVIGVVCILKIFLL